VTADDAMARVSALISGFEFWRGYLRRNRFEDDIAALIASSPEACFAAAMPELGSSVATRRAAAAVILGRLVEVTQERFATEVEHELMSALATERSINVADELATALGRAWDALDKIVDFAAMADDHRPAYRLTAAHNLALTGDSPEEIAIMKRLANDSVPRVRWWARFGLDV